MNKKLKIGKENGELVIKVIGVDDWVTDNDGFTSRSEREICFLSLGGNVMNRLIESFKNDNGQFSEFNMVDYPSEQFTYDSSEFETNK